jgi:hypothetical protein
VPFTAEPFRALLTDIVTPKYVFSLMNSLKCGLLSDKDLPILTMGTGAKRAIVITGFSVLDYRISNALIYMVLSKCVNNVHAIPTFSASQLSKWTIKVIPFANPWPFSSWDVIRGKESFYLLDDDGIPTRYDALTLRSKYSLKLHGLINEVKPELIIMLTASSEWSIMTPRPISINGYETAELSPTDFLGHFAHEGYPTIVMTIPRESGLYEITQRIIQLIRDYNVKYEEIKPLELVIRVDGDINSIANILRLHGFLIGVDGNKLIIRANEKNQFLLNSLIDNNLIEHYFNVEILEVRLQ